MSKVNLCSVCKCDFGEFKIEDEVLILDFDCQHESHDLILNVNSLGELVN